MIIDCPFCKSRVDALVEGTLEESGEFGEPPSRVSVGSCPACKRALVGVQEAYQTPPDGDWEWSDATRVWPDPKRAVSWHVPEIVKSSLEEADRCFNAGAYAACAVMCGRSLEGLCVHFGVENKTLVDGLSELRDRQIVDQRLFTWAEELRKIRNLGAHASLERVSKDDARDVLEFLHAITEYVFVLAQKFEDFMKRRKS